jgi:chemotaxis protein MotC
MRWRPPAWRRSIYVVAGILLAMACGLTAGHFAGLVRVVPIPGADAILHSEENAGDSVGAESHDGKEKKTSDKSREGDSQAGAASGLVLRSEFAMEVRRLLVSQTDAAQGVSRTTGSQKVAIARVHKLMEKVDPTRATHEDFEALAVYLLSGGSPRGTAELIDSAPKGSKHLKLMEGVKAYVLGDLETARQGLFELDTKTFQSQLGGRLLLTQAALANADDVVVQKAMLEKSASLLPGTLVEEAARRRLLRLAMKSGDSRAFARHVNRYVRRFPKSFYVDDFARVLQQGILQFEAAGKPVSRQMVKSAVSILPQNLRLDMAVTVARSSATSGLRDLCLFASQDMYAAEARKHEQDKRMLLYAAVCNVVEQPEDALKALIGFPADIFDVEDEKLRLDAINMAESIIGVNPLAQQNDVHGPELPDATTAALMVSATQQLQFSRGLIREAQ